MDQLSRMLYVSRSRIDTDDCDGLAALIRQSANRNARAGITGILAWTPDAFLQMVEGPRSGLSRLLERLHRDDRHSDLVLMDFRAAAQRTTCTWSLASPSRDAQALFEGFTYQRFLDEPPELLLERLSRVEADAAVSIVSQVRTDSAVIRV